MKRIIYIEDDVEYAKIVADFLADSEYTVDIMDDGLKAVEKVKNENYDLVICDLSLGRISGKQVIELIKKSKPKLKTIMLTNSSDEYDELSSLRVGVDDFISKETSFSILLERINRLFRTNDDVEDNINELVSEKENITVDLANREIKKDDEIIELTKIETELLIYFLSHKNQLLSRESIYTNVWHTDIVDNDSELRNIDAHIKNLRKKMYIASIVSIRGIGYRWYE